MMLGEFFREALRRYFARKIYPVYRGDWYKRKGYAGESHLERFANFLATQRHPDALYYHEFKSLELVRKFVDSGGFRLDTVWVSPKDIDNADFASRLWILCFQGRREYYESRFRDMAMMAKSTKATVIGFNPKGFHTSTGKTRVLTDIVDDGIAIVRLLLGMGIRQEQIVFYGNSLGGGIQEMVCEHFRQITKSTVKFRQINSNSFRSIGAVFATKLYMPFLETPLSRLMTYAGWEIIVCKPNFYTTGVHRCYLSRAGDQTIKKSASFGAAIKAEQDIQNTRKEYRELLKWLNSNAELIVTEDGKTTKDPHDLPLNKFSLAIQDKDGNSLSVWYFIKKYLEGSSLYL